MFGIPQAGCSFCHCFFFFQDMVSWTLPLRRRLIKPFKQPTICSLDHACWQCGWPIVAKAPGILTILLESFFLLSEVCAFHVLTKVYQALVKEAQILNLPVNTRSHRILNIRTEDYPSKTRPPRQTWLHYDKNCFVEMSLRVLSLQRCI